MQAALSRFEKGIQKGIRFCVEGAAGECSSTWLAWGNRSDYYLGVRSILGRVKISFHASGICRVAFNKSYFDDMARSSLPIPGDRALVKWKRAPTPTQGAIQVASIRFPAAYFRCRPAVGKPGKSLFVMQVPPHEQAAEVGFFFTREQEDTLYDKFAGVAQPFFITALENGEAVWMVAKPGPFSQADVPVSLANMKGFHLSGNAPAESSGLTALFWNAPSDGGILHLVEIGGIRIDPGNSPTKR